MKTTICVENLSYSPFNYEAISDVNRITEKSIEEICFASLDHTHPFMQLNTAIFSSNAIDSSRDGVIIASTINTANVILSCASSSVKLLYLYDLEWMFQPVSYDYMYNILTNKNLRLVLRSEDHIDPVFNLCKREPEAIVPEFNLEEIWNLL